MEISLSLASLIHSRRPGYEMQWTSNCCIEANPEHFIEHSDMSIFYCVSLSLFVDCPSATFFDMVASFEDPLLCRIIYSSPTAHCAACKFKTVISLLFSENVKWPRMVDCTLGRSCNLNRPTACRVVLNKFRQCSTRERSRTISILSSCKEMILRPRCGEQKHLRSESTFVATRLSGTCRKHEVSRSTLLIRSVLFAAQLQLLHVFSWPCPIAVLMEWSCTRQTNQILQCWSICVIQRHGRQKFFSPCGCWTTGVCLDLP